MIGWLRNVFRRIRKPAFPAFDVQTSSETNNAVGVAQQVRQRLDNQQVKRHREVATIRLEQIRIRNDIRRDQLTDAFRRENR